MPIQPALTPSTEEVRMERSLDERLEQDEPQDEPPPTRRSVAFASSLLNPVRRSMGDPSAGRPRSETSELVDGLKKLLRRSPGSSYGSDLAVGSLVPYEEGAVSLPTGSDVPCLLLDILPPAWRAQAPSRRLHPRPGPERGSS